MKINNRLYDFLRDSCETYLPALAVFYLAISTIWNLPYGNAVRDSILALVAFMGTCLKINRYYYNKPYQIDIEGYIDDEEVEVSEVE